VVFFDGITQAQRHSPDDCFGDHMVLHASRALMPRGVPAEHAQRL
jgi:hypothetical protein